MLTVYKYEFEILSNHLPDLKIQTAKELEVMIQVPTNAPSKNSQALSDQKCVLHTMNFEKG